MAPDAVSGVTALHSTPGTVAPKKELDNETFLALLVAQLRYQDPSSPMDTTEMMAQTNQLATMEQLVALAETSRESFALQMRMAATGLVGQQVQYVDASGELADGVVESVSFAGAVPLISIDGEQVPLDAVSRVSRTAPADV